MSQEQTLYNLAGANQSGKGGMQRQQGAGAAARSTGGNNISSHQTELEKPVLGMLYQTEMNTSQAL